MDGFASGAMTMVRANEQLLVTDAPEDASLKLWKAKC
jgi:hypothetical protein